MATRYNYTGNIVTQGLVLNLDAAKTDSYPGTGTTWRDLSGFGNNGTLTNGPTFSGPGKQASIVFDGVDDYVLDSTVNYNNYNNNFTAITWVKLNVISGGIIGWGNGGVSPFYTWVLALQNSRFRTQIFNGTNYYIDSDIIEINRWYNAAFVVYQSGLMELYINNIKFTTTGSPDLIKSRGDVNNRTIIGVNANTSSGLIPMNGNIASVQIYNRALSAAEVSQNFNALRGRYGI